MVMVNSTSFALSGEIDLASAPCVVADLLLHAYETQGTVEVDCTDLEFIDSSGCDALLLVQRVMNVDGREVRLRNLPPIARRLFAIIGIGPLFDGADSRSSAS